MCARFMGLAATGGQFAPRLCSAGGPQMLRRAFCVCAACLCSAPRRACNQCVPVCACSWRPVCPEPGCVCSWVACVPGAATDKKALPFYTGL